MPALWRKSEIYLGLAGLAVIFATVALLVAHGGRPWVVAAVAAALVAAVQGLVYWLVRRRQQQARVQAFAEIRQMLQDLINSQLTVIQTMSSLREVHPEEAARVCDYITRSVSNITSALHELSEESLVRWKRRYAAPRPTPPGKPTAGN
ncbi:MAG: hypothetical protein ACHQ4G_00095 [Opitutales bacterium]